MTISHTGIFLISRKHFSKQNDEEVWTMAGATGQHNT